MQVGWANLSIQNAVKTGPVADSAECLSECPDSVASVRPTDNVNKALVVDEPRRKLIVCGSVKQGVCSLYNLVNISQGPPEKYSPRVAANDAHSSTYAFIGPQRCVKKPQLNSITSRQTGLAIF